MSAPTSSGEKKGAVIDRLGEPVSRIEFYVFLALAFGARSAAPPVLAWLGA